MHKKSVKHSNRVKITQEKPKTSGMCPQSDCLVSGYLATMLFLARCAGLAPLTCTKKQQGWSIRLSHAWTIFGYVVISITGVCSTVTAIYESFIRPDRFVLIQTHIMQQFLSLVNLIFLVTITSLGVYRAPSLMKTMISCLNFVKEINDNITEIHDLSKYSKKWDMFLLVIWFPFILLIAITNSLVSLYYRNSNGNNISFYVLKVLYIIFEYNLMILCIQKLQFMMLTLHVSNTFKAINNELKTIMMAPSYNRRVRRLSSAYVSMCDVVRELNRSYGLILFLMLILTVKDLNVTIYYLIKEFGGKVEYTAHKIIFVVLETVWSIYHIVNIVLLIEPCHMTHAEMSTTAELVGVLMRDSYSTYQPLAVELEAFHRLLVLNQPSYSPLQVTTMTRSLVLTVFGSFATYLVILLQI